MRSAIAAARPRTYRDRDPSPRHPPLPLLPYSSSPTGHWADPACNGPDPAGHRADPACSDPDPAGHRADPACSGPDPAGHPADPACTDPGLVGPAGPVDPAGSADPACHPGPGHLGCLGPACTECSADPDPADHCGSPAFPACPYPARSTDRDSADSGGYCRRSCLLRFGVPPWSTPKDHIVSHTARAREEDFGSVAYFRTTASNPPRRLFHKNAGSVSSGVKTCTIGPARGAPSPAPGLSGRTWVQFPTAVAMPRAASPITPPAPRIPRDPSPCRSPASSR